MCIVSILFFFLLLHCHSHKYKNKIKQNKTFMHLKCFPNSAEVLCVPEIEILKKYIRLRISWVDFICLIYR